MIQGPVEYFVISFEGNQFSGEIIPALQEVVDSGTIRVIDLVFIRKDEDGNVLVVELENEESPLGDAFDTIVDLVTGLIAEADVMLFAKEMPNNSSAAALVFEHLWAVKLRDALVNANGSLVANGLVPRDVVMELIETYGQAELLDE